MPRLLKQTVQSLSSSVNRARQLSLIRVSVLHVADSHDGAYSTTSTAFEDGRILVCVVVTIALARACMNRASTCSLPRRSGESSASSEATPSVVVMATIASTASASGKENPDARRRLHRSRPLASACRGSSMNRLHRASIYGLSSVLLRFVRLRSSYRETSPARQRCGRRQ